jgi:hypothetical protein
MSLSIGVQLLHSCTVGLRSLQPMVSHCRPIVNYTCAIKARQNPGEQRQYEWMNSCIILLIFPDYLIWLLRP